MADSRSRFGLLLKEHRERKGWTLREFAEHVSFSYSHLGRMESGERNPPDRDGVIQLAEALGADVNSLLLAAGYAPVSDLSGPMLEAIEGFNKRFEPTAEEWEIIRELEERGIWYSEFTQPGFWNAPPEEREGSFLHIKGLLREHKRRTNNN